ncbi:Acetylxylan esterase precursor [Anaerohalosphaera lusitana]|uniref:Acetylxylan esterase n=1 Tax=Anaerohalosphaera lusitana TaxID=1936003 RepID=A0A1U9NGR8_9BACT|nr:GDSL-type esterase/lipase family protein [Anaerohalosphaera lusitana]AQT66948.1 Acetylxylan esterase precursor [Anaerohalosphaera lusitana]
MRNVLMSLVLAVIVFGSGCTANKCRPVDTGKFDRPVRVACVGDSITFGSGISNRNVNSYPAQLGDMLGDKWDVKNFGVSGATLLQKGDKPYWVQAAYQQSLNFKPDVVVIMLGTNDTKPQNWKHADQYVPDFKKLIDNYRRVNPDARIWICKPVPAFPGRWGIRESVIKDEMLHMVDEIAEEKNVCEIDLHETLTGKGDLFPDTVHPNAEGARVMAQEVRTALTGS